VSRVIEAEVAWKLDEVGSWRAVIEYPQGLAASQLATGTVWRHYLEGEGLMFAGVIAKIEHSADGRLTLSGPTLLNELLYRTTLHDRTWSSPTIDAVVDDLLKPTGWKRSGSLPNTLYGPFRLSDVSILKGVVDAVNPTAHFREKVTETGGVLVKELEIGTFGNPSGVTIMSGQPDPLITDDPNLAYLTDIVVEDSNEEVWNWIYPLGAGTGTTQMQLGYTPRGASGPLPPVVLTSLMGSPYNVCKVRGPQDPYTQRYYANFFIADGITVWDGFQRGAGGLGACDTGQVWVAGVGSFSIEAITSTGLRRCKVASLTGGLAVAYIDAGLGANNGLVGLRLPTVSTPGSSVVFRLSDTSNYWIVKLTAVGYDLVKRVAGSETLVGSYTVTPAIDDEIMVSLNGDSIMVLINNTVAITTTDSFNSSATRHGIRGTDINQRFDNFWVAGRDVGSGSGNSVALYGRRERAFIVKEVGAFDTTSPAIAWQLAANRLYSETVAQLKWWKQPHSTYRINVAGLPSSVMPGDKVRVRFRGVARRFDESFTYLDIDMELFVLERRRKATPEGPVEDTIIVSTLDKAMQSIDEVIIGKIEDTARAYRTAVQPSVSNHQFQIYQPVNVSNFTGTGKPVEFKLFIDNNVMQVLRCKIRLRPRPIRSTVQSQASGSSHSHTVNVSSHNHSLSGVTSEASTTPSGGSTTSEVEQSHKHVIGILGTSEAWTNPTYKIFAVLFINGPPAAPLAFYVGSQLNITTANQRIYTKEDELDAHSHSIPSHTHPAHTHSFTTQTTNDGGGQTPTSSSESSHTHAITYGVFEGTTASSIRIEIDGVDRTSELGGPWSSDATLDITQYLVDSQGIVVQGDHQIRFASQTVGAIEAWFDWQTIVAAVPN